MLAIPVDAVSAVEERAVEGQREVKLGAVTLAVLDLAGAR